jgi:hypothetical protein
MVSNLGATTLSITTFSIMTLSIMWLVTPLSINDSIYTQHNSIESHYAECCFAECRDYFNVMLSVVMQMMLSVAKLNVVILSVIAPKLAILIKY